MSIPIECPACEHNFHVPTRYGGKRGKCPECSNVFIAPKSAPASVAVEAAVSAGSEPPPVSKNGDRPANGESVRVMPKIPLPRQVVQRVATRIPEAPPKDDFVESPTNDLFTSVTESRPPSSTSLIEPPSADTPPPPPRHRPPSNTPMIVITSLLVVLVVLCISAVAILNPFGETPAAPPPNNNVVDNDTDPKDPPDDSKDADPPVELEPMPTRDDLARLWQDVLPFVCQIQVETDTDTISESGFVVDTRGWVATNYYAVKDAKSIRVRLGVGDDSAMVEARATGLIATDPQHDLAIFAIESDEVDNFLEMPLKLDADLSTSDALIAAGYNFEGDGVYAGCRVKEKVSPEVMPASMRTFLRQRNLDETGDKLIEHSLAVIAGVSGAPLLNTKGEAVAMNVRLDPDATTGFAIPISHLIALKRTGDGEVTPLPNAPEPEPITEPMPMPMPRTLTSVDTLKKLHEDATTMGWSPRTIADYETLQKLAHQVTEAQIKKDDLNIEEGLRGLLDIFSQKVLDELSNAEWPDDDDLADFNQLAADALESPEPGFIGYAKVVIPAVTSQKIDDEETVVFELTGTDTWVVLTIGENAEALAKGTRWRILGTKDPDIQISMKGVGPDMSDKTMSLIRAKYLVGPPRPGDE